MGFLDSLINSQSALNLKTQNELKNRQIRDAGNPNKFNAKYPEMSSGSRTFIQVGGKPIVLALDFNYTITAETEEIRTIDTSLPWDIAIGQIKISGTLKRFVHPDDSMEANGLFHTMQSFVHQPFVEVLCQDANGNTLLYAKGMFTSVTGAFSRGQMTTQSANFVGVAYQHWAYQEFKPYPASSNNPLKNWQKSVSKYGL